MGELIYVATYVVNAVLCALALFVTWSAIAAGRNLQACSNRFAAAAVLIGILSGFPLLSGVLWSFENAGHPVSVGHGEGLIAAPLVNFLMGFVAAGLGRSLLRWRTIRW